MRGWDYEGNDPGPEWCSTPYAPWSMCYSDRERDFLLVSPMLTADVSVFTFQFEKRVFELCGMSKSTPPPFSLPAPSPPFLPEMVC